MIRRDWAWRWSPAIGPLTLTLRFEKTVEPTPRAWLSKRPNSPYAIDAPGVFVGPARDVRTERIYADDELLCWARSYHSPDDESVAFDARTLEALIDGALGPFVWDLLDEDYVQPIAAGDDAASLARYLEGDETELGAHYAKLFAPLAVDARTAKNEDGVLAAISVAFDRWHETHGPQERPRVVHVACPRAMPSDWTAKLRAQHPRLLISIRWD